MAAVGPLSEVETRGEGFGGWGLGPSPETGMWKLGGGGGPVTAQLPTLPNSLSVDFLVLLQKTSCNSVTLPFPHGFTD